MTMLIMYTHTYTYYIYKVREYTFLNLTWGIYKNINNVWTKVSSDIDGDSIINYNFGNLNNCA